MGEFLNRGGYGIYVWCSYGIALVVLVSNAFLPRRSERVALAELQARFQGKEALDA